MNGKYEQEKFRTVRSIGFIMMNNLILKSVLYRIYSIGIAFLFFWILFGEIRTATGYTLVLELIKVVQYCCFEMMWREIPASWFKADVEKSGVTLKPVIEHDTVPNRHIIRALKLLRS
jgi:uncharacterized membrane protein